MKRLNPAAGVWLTAVLVCVSASLAHARESRVDGTWQGARLGFIGREVGDLDRSIAFYEALGFTQDGHPAHVAWSTDPAIDRLYGVEGIQTRTARMQVVNADSGQPFVVYLREVKGIGRADRTRHTPWEPGATHFALVVADAAQVWTRLEAAGLLHARSWGGKLVAPPGQTKGVLAYLTDPDGLDIELIDQHLSIPAPNGAPARPALSLGVNHMGVVILDADKCKAFYSGALGGQWPQATSDWIKGDFTDSVVGGHGNILRFFNVSFPEAIAPASRMNLELVEYQNRKAPMREFRLTDIGVDYIGLQVPNLDTALPQALGAGATVVSKPGIVTLRDGSRAVMIRDPDTGLFVQLFDRPASP